MFRDEQKKSKKRKKAQKSTLSFALDDDEGEEKESSADGTSSNSPAPGSGADEDGKLAKKAKLGKNPAVDTSFLPDRDREEMERKEREELRQEWLRKQEELKNEDIEVTYSYWDGSGHRKSVMVRGHTAARTMRFLTFIMFSVRRVTLLHSFWRSVDNNSLNFEASAWITSCILRFPTLSSCIPPLILTLLIDQEDLIIPQVGVGVTNSGARTDPPFSALYVLQLHRQ